MLLLTLFYFFYFLDKTRSVKLIIDGTIDFGPNWNFEYKVKPIQQYEPRKRISANSNRLKENENSSDTNDDETKNKDVVTGMINDVARTTMDKYNNVFVSEETDLQVTKLYTRNSGTNKPLFNPPSKIKDDSNLISFMTTIYEQALAIFEKEEDESISQKIAEIKERYASTFGNFINETMERQIKTALGRKKLILHAIEYSDKYLNRIGKRLRIDLEDSGLRNYNTVAKKFKMKIDDLKMRNYEAACKQFDICRIGNEFSDYIDELLTILLESNGVKIYAAVDAMIKVLKDTDFSTIMDTDTQKAFKRSLSNMEETNSLDRRLLLTLFKLIIEYRHYPLSGDKQDTRAMAAMLYVIEVFNKNMNMSDDKESWDNIKKDLQKWVAGGDKNVTKIAQDLVDNVDRGVKKFDDNTLSDIKSKLRIFMLAQNKILTLNRYMMFHEDGLYYSLF